MIVTTIYKEAFDGLKVGIPLAICEEFTYNIQYSLQRRYFSIAETAILKKIIVKTG